VPDPGFVERVSGFHEPDIPTRLRDINRPVGDRTEALLKVHDSQLEVIH
jgi:hypothetical protein